MSKLGLGVQCARRRCVGANNDWLTGDLRTREPNEETARSMPNDDSVPLEVIEFECEQCGASTVLDRQRSSAAFTRCLQCGPLVWDAAPRQFRKGEWRRSALHAALAGARLYWNAGYISDCSSVFDDARAVALSRDLCNLAVHEHSGVITRFRRDSPDRSGCVAFNEVTWEELFDRCPPPVPPSQGGKLAARETFDYSARISSEGGEIRCVRRSDAASLEQLVGVSPRLWFEPQRIFWRWTARCA
jgi:hypothetical protein